MIFRNHIKRLRRSPGYQVFWGVLAALLVDRLIGLIGGF